MVMELASGKPLLPPIIDTTGVEWIVDAMDCDVELLRRVEVIQAVCEKIVETLGLNVVGVPQVHKFSGEGGVTALYLLSESHLACHTYPEHQLATFNLYCCRNRDAWPWSDQLEHYLGAKRVRVQSLLRGNFADSMPRGEE